MKFVSWNVNGIRACLTKGFEERFQELDADIFCLQETKCQEGQVKLELPGYHQYWNYANRRGYSGTAIFTKQEPLSAFYGIGIEEHDKEGRVITLEFEEFYFVTVYTPNSQSELRRLEYRMEWERDFLAYLLKLQESKPVICCGDLNVAHEEIDLKNPKTYNEKLNWLKLHDKNPIYTRIVDKFEAKEYVKDIIGDQYIIPTLGVWDKFDDIDFDELPQQFVLKCTHDSEGLVIVKDKDKLDKEMAKNKID